MANRVLIKIFVGLMPALIIRIISPIIRIRVSCLISRRIGHFAANTELYLCEKDHLYKNHRDSIDLFFLEKPPVCNKYLKEKWASTQGINLIPRLLGESLSALLKYLPGGDQHYVPENIQFDRDILGLYQKGPCHIKFTDAEMEKGNQFLRSLGISRNDKFICLTVRDSEYLKSCLPGQDWSAHNYRDSDIDTYLKGCQALADLGYFVFRMGACVSKPFQTTLPRIFDYATSGMRTEFLDIFLGAKCDFCITQGTGFDAIPIIFRRPILQVNAAPLGYCYSFVNNCLVMPKHVLDKVSGRSLSLKEQSERGVLTFLSAEEFEDNGVSHLDNSESEIYNACLEMHELVTSVRNGESRSISERQFIALQSFNKYVRVSANNVPLHGTINFSFSEYFLTHNNYFIESINQPL